MQARASGVQRRGKRERELALGAALICVVVAVRTFFAVLFGRLFKGPRHPGWGFRYEVAASVMRNVQQYATRFPPSELRKYTLPTLVPLLLRRKLTHRRTSFAGLYAELFEPRVVRRKGTLLYFHGGGYIVGSPATHRELIARVAAVTGMRTIAVAYRKAPEHPYPAPIDDCELAYRTLLDEGVLPEDIVLAGDSAGGGLVLSVLLRAREAGLAMPSAAVLFSPWVDLSRSGESVRKNEPFDYLSPASLDYAVEHYLQGQEHAHPHVSHLQAELHGLPPMLVITGTAELFYSENVSFVARARAHGVAVEHHVEQGMVHVSPLLTGFAPSAGAVLAHVARFVAEHAPGSAATLQRTG